MLSRVIIAALIAPELILLSVPFDPQLLPGTANSLSLDGQSFVQAHEWWIAAMSHGRLLAKIICLFAAAAIVFSWDDFRRRVADALHSESERGAARAGFLVLHVAAVAGLVAWSELILSSGTMRAGDGRDEMLVAAGLFAVAALSWMGALFSPTFWMQWVRKNPGAILAALCIAILARWAGLYTVRLWTPLTAATFQSVEFTLRLLGQVTIVKPAERIIGTQFYSVEIRRGCSGLEGIGLVAVFVAAYLWLYRSELRFPISLILLPAAGALIWVFNVIRITALILIGGWSPRIAIDGFHSVAGWLFYTLAVCGVVAASRSVPAFSKSGLEPRDSTERNPAAMYLAPLLTILAIGMTARIFDTAGFDLLYPLKVAGAGIVLWIYRDQIRAHVSTAAGTMPVYALTLGAVAFVAWIFLQRGAAGAVQDTEFRSHLGAMPALLAAMWLIIRVLGAVVTVPIAEELAFRGYLLRKLVSADFESVGFQRFTWTSFLVSSVLFGLMHQQWIAGVIAGMLFALAMYRRGSLRDAVVAHATANALLAVYVLTTHSWSLWN